MAERVIGVIGGSGLYQLEGIEDIQEVPTETPYGSPSSVPMIGRYGDSKVVFIPRHGKAHTITPSDINYRANIYAMKQHGVQWLLSVSAVGSMKEELKPGDMVVVDQFLDRTKARPSTFFGDGVVAHLSFGDPVCPVMFGAIGNACEAAGVTYHKGGTYVCMEGPQFSTRAESNVYRSWGVSVIGMTNLPEAKLAREAEISYGTLAMVTDYDCWHEGHDEVTAQTVVQTLLKNVDTARKVFSEFLKHPPTGTSPCHTALKDAIVTRPEDIPSETRQRLGLLIERYIG